MIRFETTVVLVSPVLESDVERGIGKWRIEYREKDEKNHCESPRLGLKLRLNLLVLLLDLRPWSSEIYSFLDNSLSEMAEIGKSIDDDSTIKKIDETTASCAICCLAKNREFTQILVMPGGSMKIVRETPTSAIVRFKAGSVEPAHHHTFGHDLVVIKGKKSVWNLSKERADLVDGDYLFTLAGDVHRVKYHEDTEFFISWDGHWDIFFDEDLETAKKAMEEEA